MVLSDMAVRRAKATGSAYDLYDALGLYLAVTDNGGKSWHFRYYWLGKRKRMSFGTSPQCDWNEINESSTSFKPAFHGAAQPGRYPMTIARPFLMFQDGSAAGCAGPVFRRLPRLPPGASRALDSRRAWPCRHHQSRCFHYLRSRVHVLG